MRYQSSVLIVLTCLFLSTSLVAQDTTVRHTNSNKSLQELIDELDKLPKDSAKSEEYVGDFDLEPTYRGSTTKFLQGYEPSRHDKGYNSSMDLEEHRQTQRDAEVQFYLGYLLKIVGVLVILFIGKFVLKRYFF